MSTALSPAPRYDPRADTVESLDARLVALARGDAPLRRVLARVAGRLVETRSESPEATGAGWEPLGFARPADYARERPGLSARELHELAHVDAALARLPGLEAAFAGGRLGWTKARLLCRVATAADEARWLAAAGRLSAAALAREVRACDVGALEAGGVAAAGAKPDPEREVLRVRAPRRVLTQWGDVKRMLRLVAGEWLPTETCVELVAAEVLSAVGLEAGAGDAPPLARGCRARASPGAGEAGPVREPPAAPGAPAVAALPWVAALAAGLDDADPRELDARLCRAAAFERGWLARELPKATIPGLAAAARVRRRARPPRLRLPQPRRLRARAPRHVAAQGPRTAPARARLRAQPGPRGGVAGGAPRLVARAGARAGAARARRGARV